MSQDDEKHGAEIPPAGEPAAPQTGAERFRESLAPRGGDDPEEDLWQGGYSPKAMVGWWIVAGVITIGAIVALVMFGMQWLPYAASVAALSWVVPAVQLAYMRLAVHYRLTSQRFFHEKGVLSRTTDRIEAIDMDDIQYTQGLIERMLNVGTIRIKSSDASHPWLEVKGIDDVKRVASMMDDARRQERVRRGIHIANV